MANDIEINVKVDDQSGGGLAGVTSSLKALKKQATDTGTALVSLATRSTVAGTALDAMGDQADDAEHSLAGLRAAARDIKVKATLDDDTATGIAAVRAALADLKAESPLHLRVDFDGGAGDITTTSGALQTLRTRASAAGTAVEGLGTKAAAAAAELVVLAAAADEAGDKLRDLRSRAAAAAAEVQNLRSTAVGAGNAMQTFSNRTNTANSRVDDLSTRTRTLRTDMTDLDGALTRVGGNMNGLRGSVGSLGSSSSSASGGMEKLTGAALTLAPALVPIASSITPAIPLLGAGALGAVAFGAALLGQVGAMTDAATAQAKYTAAVAKYGPASKQAATAEGEYMDTLSAMPPATRTAAAALSALKDEYHDWSDELAGSTMPVATHGFELLGGTIGRLTPLAKDSGTQMGRLVTIIGGGVASPGFDKFMDEVDAFAHKALLDMITGTLRLGEALHNYTGSGQLQEFMAYARANGPLVADTLKNLAGALAHLVEGAGDVGVSMLTVVNILAKLVNAVPPEAIGDLLQLAAAYKGLQLAVAGGSALKAGVTGVATAVGGMRTASAGATGGVASLTAAFGSLSKGAKVAAAGTGLGLLIIALGALSQAGKSAPPSVDAITTSLEKLADTGRVTGAAADAWGKDLSGLAKSLDTLVKPSGLDSFQQSLTHLIGMDSTPVKDAKDNIDSLDKALAGLVQNGHADIAAQALADLTIKLKAQGLTSKQIKSQLDDYKQALADQAFEAKLAAQAQGLFGEQAQQVKAKLDAQKQSTDGLRNSIQALNDVNRSALGGMIGFEQAIDDAAKAARDNAGALTMSHGALNLSSQKARDAASALSDLADKTDEAAADARDSGASWSTVAGIYDRGRSNLEKFARSMGLTKDQAKTLTNQILKMPDKTTLFKGDVTDLNAKIKSAQAKVDSLKQKRKTAVGADKSNLDAQIKAAQRSLDNLKQKRAAAIKASNQAGAGAGAAQRTINGVHGKTVTITTRYVATYGSGYSQHAAGNPYFAHGGVTGSLGRAATGGPRGGLTLVGEQGPELVDLAAGSRVRSNPDTKRLLAGGAASASGAAPININLVVDGGVLARAVFDPLRNEIRTRKGGDVQKALGWTR
ncbi:hypothetical protein [Streptomyces tremellae]|uniref:Phage tail tape measure protein domain-containing protein n=1 Tax=Streptomyces tremellae TaxID=1124239 RepID=A0ABP7EF53_9ACTN